MTGRGTALALLVAHGASPRTEIATALGNGTVPEHATSLGNTTPFENAIAYETGKSDGTATLADLATSTGNGIMHGIATTLGIATAARRSQLNANVGRQLPVPSATRRGPGDRQV